MVPGALSLDGRVDLVSRTGFSYPASDLAKMMSRMNAMKLAPLQSIERSKDRMNGKLRAPAEAALCVI